MIFYDNIPPASVEAELATVDRVYTLALSDFSPFDWATLESIYASLPGWIGSDDDGCACWHGPTHSQPFLIASVELSGLHITGRLDKHDWERWHEAFMASIRELPTLAAMLRFTSASKTINCEHPSLARAILKN